MDEGESLHMSMTYEEATSRLAAALRFGIEPSLDGIDALARQLGEPQKKFISIQVAGTNGKSSTARMLAAILHAEGYRVGLYTSPHLVEYPERFEIDGKVISHEAFTRHVSAAFRAADECCAEATASTSATNRGGTIDYAGVPISGSEVVDAPIFTEFELLTAAAFSLFAAEQVDFAVLEVGLGGRWDATSVVTPTVAVICGIGLDHTQILGDTLEKIAAEKAAIIKPGSIPVLGPGTAGVASVFLEAAQRTQTIPRAVCAKKDSLLAANPDHPSAFPTMPPELTLTYEVRSTAPLLYMDVSGCCGQYDGIVMDKPYYQAANAAVAICAAEAALGRALKPTPLAHALSDVVIPGRFETLSKDPLLIIDGAHNPQGARALHRAIIDRFEGGDPPTLLLAILEDKDASGIIDALADVSDALAVTSTWVSRSMSPENLADLVFERLGKRPEIFHTPKEAISTLMGRGATVVAAGSITLAGAIEALFVGDEEPNATQ